MLHRTNKDLVGYKICVELYPSIKSKIDSFLRGEGLGLLVPTIRSSSVEMPSKILKNCPKCKTVLVSPEAKFCELCGAPLLIACQGADRKLAWNTLFCTNCGKKIE